jgi:hypothetical protein
VFHFQTNLPKVLSQLIIFYRKSRLKGSDGLCPSGADLLGFKILDVFQGMPNSLQFNPGLHDSFGIGVIGNGRLQEKCATDQKLIAFGTISAHDNW